MDDSQRPWRLALAYAVPISVLVLGLFYYWFAVGDRFFIFLYNHDMGARVPDTSPFSAVTSSRYWMAGLVACGLVLVLYAAANWLLGRLRSGYCAPDWWRVWALVAVPLAVGIPWITMTVNQPVLPLRNAAQATLATLIGLALALLPGRMAAGQPGALAWLAADGWGLMLVLVTVIGLQHLPWWLAHGGTWWIVMVAAMLAAGSGWLLAVTGLRFWRRTPVPEAATLFVAGLIVAYLLMPLLHHVLGTDGYYYITNSNNFFADSLAVQLAAWLAAAAVAAGLTWLRRSLARRRPARNQAAQAGG